MIMSFADKRTAAVFAGLHVRQLGADGAAETGAIASRGQNRRLAVPPGNRLEKLSGDRNGQWIIRITMTSGGSALSGATATLGMWRSWTITEGGAS